MKTGINEINMLDSDWLKMKPAETKVGNAHYTKAHFAGKYKHDQKHCYFIT